MVKLRATKIWLGVLALVTGLILFGQITTHRAFKQPDIHQQFQEFFSDLSIGVPEYTAIKEFLHPADTVKGDYFSCEFSQNEIQFQKLATELKISEKQILEIPSFTVNSKINPKYPWHLDIKITNTTQKLYTVHLEGRQPYN